MYFLPYKRAVVQLLEKTCVKKRILYITFVVHKYFSKLMLDFFLFISKYTIFLTIRNNTVALRNFYCLSLRYIIATCYLIWSIFLSKFNSMTLFIILHVILLLHPYATGIQMKTICLGKVFQTSTFLGKAHDLLVLVSDQIKQDTVRVALSHWSAAPWHQFYVLFSSTYTTATRSPTWNMSIFSEVEPFWSFSIP